MNQILLRPEVPLSRLNRGVAEQQLDLLKLAAGGSAQLRAGSAQIVRRQTGETRSPGVASQKLPDNFLAHGLTLDSITTVHRAENVPRDQRCRRCPRIDRHLDPGRHRHGPHPTVLADKIHNAPTSVPLLEM